ncbi:MAG: twin-arginine translocase subunit TatC, partial [Planctomycetota bacterium]
MGDHLVELRARLIRSLIAVGVGLIVAAVFVRDLVSFLCIPLQEFARLHPEKDVRIITEKLQAGFTTIISVSLFGGLVLAMPFVLWQVWGFIRPALKSAERAAATFLVAFGTLLFLAGAAVGHFYAAPAALRFFFFLNEWLGIELTTGMPEYIKLVLTLMLGFGVGFQLPLVMLVLSWVGITDAAFFRARRKYALVLAFVFGAILTPPDVPSQLIMAGCLLLL